MNVSSITNQKNFQTMSVSQLRKITNSNCLIANLIATALKFTIICEEYKEGLITVDRFFVVCTYA